MAILLSLLFLIVLGTCILYSYLFCREYGIGPWGEKAAAEKSQEIKALYFNYSSDYVNFAEIVWCCASALGSSCGLMVSSSDPGSIFCQRPSERISMHNGRITFAYEIPKTTNGMLQRDAIRPKDMQKRLNELESAFLGRLPDYLRGGYFFIGGVSVFNAGRNCIRVEVHGVNRNIPVQVGGFQI